MIAKPINIVIADAQYLIRLGLRHLFEQSSRINVVDEAENQEELLAIIMQAKVDVVIFDHNQTDCFSADDIKKVKSISPKTNFLIISADNDKDSIFNVLQSGGLSYLTKSCDREEIINAVIATSKGEKFLCNKVIDVILDKQITPEEETCAPTNLTARELEIVKLTAEGLSAAKVAEQLFLSTHTVYTHRKNIMKKLGINSASQLIVYAINNGI